MITISEQQLGELVERAAMRATKVAACEAWERGFTRAIELAGTLLSQHGHLGAVHLLDQAMAARDQIRPTLDHALAATEEARHGHRQPG